MLGERHNQLDHANINMEYLGFDPSTSSLLTTHASDCANTLKPGSGEGIPPGLHPGLAHYGFPDKPPSNCPGFGRRSYYAEVSSERTNLSPFTKDYRGLAFKCDFLLCRAREGTHFKRNIKKGKTYF